MDNIRQALERARGPMAKAAVRLDLAPPAQPSHAPLGPTVAVPPPLQVREIVLAQAHLEANRIIAHDETDPRARSFDMLRTQVLQAMDQKSWRVIGITSPTPGCGKTVTATNLAFSIARQSERASLLVDLDLQKPQVAATLGVNCSEGIVAVLEGRCSLSSAVIQARAGASHILALPAESSASDSSAWMTSRTLSTTLQDIKRDYRSQTIILDLPPMLAGDDVIAVLPQLDCLLFVAAVGKSKVSEIEECNKHLRSTEVVRLVLNKVPAIETNYYGYYRGKNRR
jgi:protein-tyrosine kinase